MCDEASDRCVPAAGAADGSTGAPDGGSGRSDGGGAVDAGGRDAGGSDAEIPIVDAGGEDASVDPTSCAALHAARSFCDDFETGDTSRWEVAYAPNGSSLVVIDASAGPVHRGAHALRAEAVVGSEGATVVVNGLPTGDVPDYWLRAFFYLPAATPLECEINAIGDVDDNHQINAYLTAAGTNLHTHGLVMDLWQTEPITPSRDRWVCFEMHVHIDATDGAVELYADDEPVVTGTGLDTSIVRPLQRIAVGIHYKDETDPTQVLYVDDVVADTTRIGCE